MKIISVLYRLSVLSMLGFLCYKVYLIDLISLDTHQGLVTLFQLLLGGRQ